MSDKITYFHQAHHLKCLTLMKNPTREIPYDEDEAERILEEGERVYEALFEAYGEDASPMSDGSNYAIRHGNRYLIEVFDEPYIVEADSLRDLIVEYDLHAITGILRSVECAELGHDELAKLLYAPGDDVPEHLVRINGEPYTYATTEAGDGAFQLHIASE